MKDRYWLLIHGLILIFIGIIQSFLIKGDWLNFEKSMFIDENLGWLLFVLLIALDIILFYFSRKNIVSSKIKQLLDRLCKEIFQSFIDKNVNLINSDFRVSIFLVVDKFKLLRPRFNDNWGNFKKFLWNYFPIFLWKYNRIKYLKNYGRYQSRGDSRLSKICFLKGEGVVGMSYKLGQKVIEHIDAFDINDKNKYIDQQVTLLQIPKFKVRRLKDEFCNYLGCPIAHYNKEGYYAVVMIDSLKNNNDLDNNFNDLESFLEIYSPFFVNPKAKI